MKSLGFLSVLAVAACLSVTVSHAQKRFDVFPTKSEKDIPYRIPAIASLPDGTLVCVADYRHSRKDIGLKKDGRLDLHVRVSADNGCSWGEIVPLVEGFGEKSPDFMSVAYGDPCIVADRRSGRVLVMSCAGNISFPKGTRDCHQGIVRFYSDDKGKTWTAPEDIAESIYCQFDDCPSGPIRAMFVASGKILQSRYVRTKGCFRLYCAVLVSRQDKSRMNHVLYSDDFGKSWNVLGGAGVAPIPVGADEAKVEELPGGDILISSRTAKEGRFFNIYKFDDRKKATGSWGEMVHSSSHNSGIVTKQNDCNGELLMVQVVRNEDGRKMNLLLQSAPMGPRRANVGIYYKCLVKPEDYDSPGDIAADWDGVYQVTDKGSAYSTMALQPDGLLGFLYEEETHCTAGGGGYTIVYESISVEQITGGKYRLRK